MPERILISLPRLPIGWIVASLLWLVPELALGAADTLKVIVGRSRDTFSVVLEAAASVIVLTPVGTATVALRNCQNSAGSCDVEFVKWGGWEERERLNTEARLTHSEQSKVLEY